MNELDKDADEAIAYIRRSTAEPIRRYLDRAAEHRLGDPWPAGSRTEPPASKRLRSGGRRLMRWIARSWARLRPAVSASAERRRGQSG
jgi:hypothetical protein